MVRVYCILCYVRSKNLGLCQIRPFWTKFIISSEINCFICLFNLVLIVLCAKKTSDAKNLAKSQIMGVTYSFAKPYETLQNQIFCSIYLVIQYSQLFRKFLSSRGIGKLKKINVKSFKDARRGNVTYGFSSSISNF